MMPTLPRRLLSLALTLRRSAHFHRHHGNRFEEARYRRSAHWYLAWARDERDKLRGTYWEAAE